MSQLDGRAALVTGAARVIGKAIAIGLSHEGASVVPADKNGDGMKGTDANLLPL